MSEETITQNPPDSLRSKKQRRLERSGGEKPQLLTPGTLPINETPSDSFAPSKTGTKPLKDKGQDLEQVANNAEITALRQRILIEIEAAKKAVINGTPRQEAFSTVRELIKELKSIENTATPEKKLTPPAPAPVKSPVSSPTVPTQKTFTAEEIEQDQKTFAEIIDILRTQTIAQQKQTLPNLISQLHNKDTRDKSDNIHYYGTNLLFHIEDPEIFKLLIKSGADIHVKNDYHGTPLHMVRSAEIAKLLINAGADVNAKGKYYGYTPLHNVRSVEIAKLLINAGADINAKCEAGSTPLCIASFAVAELLIKSGADVNTKDWMGQTSLHGTNSEASVKLLIDAGADVHAKDQDERTPLHKARSSEIAKVLIKAGADVHAKDLRGRTPLHEANSIEMVQLLIGAGADVNATTEFGHTPLHVTRSAEIAKLLINAGADINAENNAKEKAPILNDPEVIKFLESRKKNNNNTSLSNPSRGKLLTQPKP